MVTEIPPSGLPPFRGSDLGVGTDHSATPRFALRAPGQRKSTTITSTTKDEHLVSACRGLC